MRLDLQRTDSPSLWILTDGKAGDEAQCLGVSEALGAEAEIRRVAPRRPYAWLMPRGPIDPAERPDRENSPLAPPFPDIVIASGRRSVPYVRFLRRHSPRTFTVFLKDPRTGADTADFLWVPEHDALRGANVLATPTSPHRFSATKLQQLRDHPPAELKALDQPRVAVLVGGDSRHHHFSDDNISEFMDHLAAVESSGASLMMTMSRRTPARLAARIGALAETGKHLLWDGTGENPLPAYLANADMVVVTADSTNMVGEAAATGRPVLVFEPDGGHAKISKFLSKMSALGVTRPFAGQLETYTYEPIDSTPVIAAAILAGYRRKAEARSPT